MLSLNRSFAAPLRSDKFWRFLSSRLATEHNVYVPQTLPGVDRSWRSLFLELYKNNRNMWDSHPSSSLVPLEEGSARYQSEAQGFKISVFARFRPEDEESKKKAKDKHRLKMEQKKKGKGGNKRKKGGADSSEEEDAQEEEKVAPTTTNKAPAKGG